MRTGVWLAGSAGVLTAGLVFSPSESLAGGFQISELCAECSGARIAGQAAKANGASTVWFNPAGMTKLEGRQIDASAHVIAGKFKFKNVNSRKAVGVDDSVFPPTAVSPGGPALGKQSSDGASPALVPNLYATWKLDERWAVGLGVNAPYGLVVEYDETWVGRYDSIKSDLFNVNINPSVAYQVTDWLSLGVGVNATYVDAELTNAVDFGSIVTALSPLLAGSLGMEPASFGSDGRGKLTGNDWGYGYNLGALFSFNEDRTRIGMSYRSQIDTTLDGELKTKLPTQLWDLVGTESKVDGKADLNLPATFNIGLSQDIGEQWTVLVGGMWTGWDSFSDITIKLEDGHEIVQPENWFDVWRVNVGAEYRYSPRWTFRAGYEYDNSPVKQAFNTTRIPDEDRQWLALGFTYSYSDSVKVDFAYSHIFIDDYGVNIQEVITEQTGRIVGEGLGLSDSILSRLDGIGNTTTGTYDSSADIFSLGIRYRF